MQTCILDKEEEASEKTEPVAKKKKKQKYLVSCKAVKLDPT